MKKFLLLMVFLLGIDNKLPCFSRSLPSGPSASFSQELSTLPASASQIKKEDMDIQDDLKAIVSKGYIIVALHAEDHPPFHMVDPKTNKLIGVDIDVAHELGRLLNIDVKFDRRAKTYDEVVDLVLKGEADIGISKLSFTPQRAINILYTLPYIELTKTVIVNRLKLASAEPGTTLRQLLDNPSASIGVIPASSYGQFARVLFPQAKIIEAPWDDVVAKVHSGEITAGFRDDNEIGQLFRKKPATNLTILGITLKGELDRIACVVAKRNMSFHDWMDGTLANNRSLQFNLKESLQKYKDYL